MQILHPTACTAEERSALTALVQSPGWEVLLVRWVLPRLQAITHQLDQPGIEGGGRGDFLRGQKRALLALLDLVYQSSGRQNPLERHALALLRDLSGEREPRAEVSPLPEVSASPPPVAPQQEVPHGRGSVPV